MNLGWKSRDFFVSLVLVSRRILVFICFCEFLWMKSVAQKFGLTLQHCLQKHMCTVSFSAMDDLSVEKLVHNKLETEFTACDLLCTGSS